MRELSAVRHPDSGLFVDFPHTALHRDPLPDPWHTLIFQPWNSACLGHLLNKTSQSNLETLVHFNDTDLMAQQFCVFRICALMNSCRLSPARTYLLNTSSLNLIFNAVLQSNFGLLPRNGPQAVLSLEELFPSWMGICKPKCFIFLVGFFRFRWY